MRLLPTLLLICFSLIKSISTVIYTCDPSASCGCSSITTATIDARIVGGELVSSRTWGWMVSLQYYERHRCGASLISAEYAITAAHCVDQWMATPERLSILAGRNNLSASTNTISQRRTIISIYMHPNYDSVALNYDIAVLRFLPLSTASSSTLSFVCLPKSGQDPFVDGDDLIATGWGYIREGAGVSSNSLRQVTVKAIPSTESYCVTAPIGNPKIKFCAGIENGGKDTCQGDSGGPLLAFNDSRWTLAGITSGGVGCARPKNPGLYTRVSNFIPYIQSVQAGTTATTADTTFSLQFTQGQNEGSYLHPSYCILICGWLIQFTIKQSLSSSLDS